MKALQVVSERRRELQALEGQGTADAWEIGKFAQLSTSSGVAVDTLEELPIGKLLGVH